MPGENRELSNVLVAIGILIMNGLIIAGFFCLLDESRAELLTNQIPTVENSNLVPGAHVEFGGYDWRVLEVQDSQALLLSDKIIERQYFHIHNNTNTTWADCTLRNYLNNGFFNAFNQQDQARIAAKEIITINPQRNTDNIMTYDRIFLLSVEDVKKYRQLKGSNVQRVAVDKSGGAYWWWLRTPGKSSNSNSTCAAYVSSEGAISIDGTYVSIYSDHSNWDKPYPPPPSPTNTLSPEYEGRGGVRPALWLNL